MAYETKCQILIVNKKLAGPNERPNKKNLNMRKQKIRDETPKTTYSDFSFKK